MKLNIVYLCLFWSQTGLPAEKVAKRTHTLHAFLQYVQRTDYGQLNRDTLFTRYLSFEKALQDSSRMGVKQKEQIFSNLLQDLDQSLGQMDIGSLDATSWHAYPYPEKLPKMLWKLEPVEQIGGTPVDHPNYERSVVEGKKQLQNTLVVHAESTSDKPLFFVLFDPAANQIASWFLIRQDDHHYFLVF